MSRLIIWKVVLDNFKSYAGIKEIGPFHQNLTAVVGPNGSGKSNLLECFLFAFGKSARKMRLKKLKELIHKSAEYPDLPYASVTVYFFDIIDHENGYEIQKNSKLELTRIVKRDSRSYFKLNGQKTTYETISKTLNSKGIDLNHNRFLILQGEIEQIAMMKPYGDEQKVGLLEYLEDIIGTNRYLPAIKEAEQALESIGEEVIIRASRFEQVEKELERLEFPREKAVEYIRLQEKVHQIRNLKYQVNLYNCKIKRKGLYKETEGINSKIKELDNQHMKISSEDKELLMNYQQISGELKRLRDNEESYKETLNEYIKKDAHLTENIRKLKEDSKEHEDNLHSLKARIRKLKEKISRLEQEIPLLTTRTEELQKTKLKSEEKYKNINMQIYPLTEPLQRQKSYLEQALLPYTSQLQDLKTRLDITQSRIETIKLLDSSNQKDIEDLRTQREVLNAKSKTFAQETKTLKKALNSLQTQLSQTQLNYNKATDETATVQDTISHLKLILQQTEQIEQKSEGSSKLLEELNKASLSGALEGIYGRLGDLGTVPAEYDIAVSSAAPRLDYILVKTASHASRVLAFVREKRLGKVNILDLSRVSQLYNKGAHSSARLPYKRLFELIDTERVFLPAFYFVLQNTVVASTLEDAREIAFGTKRRRVVTMTGEILNPSGEMQGFAHPKRGKIKLQGNSFRPLPENSSNLHSILEDKICQARDLQSKLSLYYSEIEAFSLRERTISQEIQAIERENEEIQTELLSLSENIKKIQEESAKNELKPLLELEDSQAKALEKAENAVKTGVNELETIEKAIEKQGGREFQRIKQRALETAESHKKLQEELLKLTHKQSQCPRDLAAIKAKQRFLQTKLTATKHSAAQTTQEKQSLHVQSQQLIKDFEASKSLRTHNEAELLSLESLQDSLHIHSQSIDKQKSELTRALKAHKDSLKCIDTEISQCTCHIQTNRAEYSNMWSDYATVPQPDTPQSKRALSMLNYLFSLDQDLTESELLPLRREVPTLNTLESNLQGTLIQLNPDLDSLALYTAKFSEKLQKQLELTQLKSKEASLRSEYNSLSRLRFTEFSVGFSHISGKLREMYRFLTRGGDAELEFADSTDPFSEGILFTVRPPLKSWKKMHNLSGGEKTLSSLSLVFALQHYRPSALYVFDEVDAALDHHNVSIVASYIKSRTKHIQFVIVSLRCQMFEVADRLVGIYKTQGISRSLAITPVNSLVCSIKGI